MNSLYIFVKILLKIDRKILLLYLKKYKHQNNFSNSKVFLLLSNLLIYFFFLNIEKKIIIL
jgi:hypothetical protein